MQNSPASRTRLDAESTSFRIFPQQLLHSREGGRSEALHSPCAPIGRSARCRCHACRRGRGRSGSGRRPGRRERQRQPVPGREHQDQGRRRAQGQEGSKRGSAECGARTGRLGPLEQAGHARGGREAGRLHRHRALKRPRRRCAAMGDEQSTAARALGGRRCRPGARGFESDRARLCSAPPPALRRSCRRARRLASRRRRRRKGGLRLHLAEQRHGPLRVHVHLGGGCAAGRGGRRERRHWAICRPPARRTAGYCSTRRRSRTFSGPALSRCRRRRTAYGRRGRCSSQPRPTT